MVAVTFLLVGSGGGMRSITSVQAVQFWVKLAAVAVSAAALLGAWHLHGAPTPLGDGPPRFDRTTRVHVRTDVAVTVPVPVTVTARGRLDGLRRHGEAVTLTEGRHTIGRETEVVFPEGAAVPHAERLPLQADDAWATPFGRDEDHELFGTYSALLGVLLGTMGLPHILMRFYTNGCGSAARRTAALIPVLLALFYVFPTVYAALGRVYAPELLMTGDTDAAVLLLPQRMTPGPAGALLTGLITAGAFAAFISTSCGLAVAIAGTIAQGVRRSGITAFRAGVVLALGAPLVLLPRIGPQSAAGPRHHRALRLGVHPVPPARPRHLVARPHRRRRRRRTRPRRRRRRHRGHRPPAARRRHGLDGGPRHRARPDRRPGRLHRHGRGVPADPPPRPPRRRPRSEKAAPPRGRARALKPGDRSSPEPTAHRVTTLRMSMTTHRLPSLVVPRGPTVASHL
ncbi:sodium:solute symporter family transporter [Actinomadura madurae]|uniref:sodium:solute symporter family transporter n=1 Tax=Actinomadura madurae TaxID=1993 RepID=UPI0020D228C5|nr:hypothetical protein [Actinomadura madurae]MCP9984086.1 hypothetical protein [Actinomadura madurae]